MSMLTSEHLPTDKFYIIFIVICPLNCMLPPLTQKDNIRAFAKSAVVTKSVTVTWELMCRESSSLIPVLWVMAVQQWQSVWQKWCYHVVRMSWKPDLSSVSIVQSVNRRNKDNCVVMFSISPAINQLLSYNTKVCENNIFVYASEK
jgi:hypothetical protein